MCALTVLEMVDPADERADALVKTLGVEVRARVRVCRRLLLHLAQLGHQVHKLLSWHCSTITQACTHVSKGSEFIAA